MLLAEWFLFGVPTASIGLSQKVSKGILLELISRLMPFVYVGLSAILIFPLIEIAIRSYQLKKIINDDKKC